MMSNTINDAVTMQGGAEGALLANRYRIVRQLGQGGMGSVWLAEDTQLDGKLFAIKMLPSILVSNKRAYRQLKDEALVAMKLTHTNIVTLRAFEENNGNPFLVMDYVDGQTLDDYLAERGTLAEQETVSLLLPVAAALDYAHAKNIIHRDIKPGNVMIAGDGTPYVLDFGIAREMQEATTRVTGKLSSGTLMYMSPEQLHGSAPKAAQDIYSFATMVYECLAGAPPFTRGQIEYQIEHDAPAPLPESFSIAKMVMSGLAKRPEDRPATCSSVLGLSGTKLISSAIPARPSVERIAPSRAPSGQQDVAERLLQSAQAVLEVDRMLAEVAKFEDSCRNAKIHSSRMAIKAARGEMESASGARCIELLEAAKVIFAEAKSVYDDSVAKRHFIDEISTFISRAKGYRELRDESGVFACLREVERLKVEAENAAVGAWQALQEEFLRARERTEAEIRASLERNREAAEKRRLEEVARRQQEELKKRRELEERKRKEQAEIKSCREKVDAVKQEIRDACQKVVAYVQANPDYGDCLPIAQAIRATTDEEEPTDLPGMSERLNKLERDLARVRSLISNHDVVVCATLNDLEVGRASMLYGARRIDLPVRIKRRHRLRQDEGYLLEYARGKRKYCGWFSPTCVKSSEGQCAMVPLRSEPSISEISRAYRKKKPVRFAGAVLVALVASVEVSVLVGLAAYGCFVKCEWGDDACRLAAVAFGLVSVVLGFRSLYCRMMRRGMCWAICDNGQYKMHPQSTFNESVLLLNRKERPTSELFKEFKLHNWVKCLWHLLVTLYISLHVGLLIGVFVGVALSPDAAVFFGGLPAFLAASFLLGKRALRREKRGNLIGHDDYRAKRTESPAVKEAKEPPEKDRVQAGKSSRCLVLWAVVACILVVGGVFGWQYWEIVQAEKAQRERLAERQANAEREARRNAEIRHTAEMIRRQQDEEKRKSEAAELERGRKEIADKVGSAEQKVREAEKYHGDSVGFETHLASLDAAAAKLKSIQEPKTGAEADDILKSVTAADGEIASELNWFRENMPRREAARRIEKEMRSGLDAELVRFEVSAHVADRYLQGLTLRQEGNAALGKGDFALAQTKLAEAKATLTDALAEAKEKRKRQQLAEAERRKQEEERLKREEEERKAKAEAQRPPKEKAIELFKKGSWQDGYEYAQKADQNDAELQFWLGTYHDIGRGADCDSQEAFACFRRAAEMGQIDAQCELGRRYESGLGVSLDIAQAKRWYLAAARQGSRSAEDGLRRLSSLDKVVRDDSARVAIPAVGERPVSSSGRSSVRFTKEDADTLSRLTFSSPRARIHYEWACELAKEGARNKAKVRSEYNTGRICGGPKWPELEAWLDWWE